MKGKMRCFKTIFHTISYLTNKYVIPIKITVNPIMYILTYINIPLSF